VLGADGGETVPPLAALCNGAAGTVLELDEGHRFAAGHPAIHVLPALLADAEIGYGDSDAFVRSFVAGYEVAVRTARAVGTLESGYHPHGVWGRSAARPQWHALADSTRRRRARPWPSRRTTRNTPGSRRRRRARPCGTSTPA